MAGQKRLPILRKVRSLGDESRGRREEGSAVMLEVGK